MKYTPPHDYDGFHYDYHFLPIEVQKRIIVEDHIITIWVGSWISIIFFKLLMKLLNICVHVPPGKPNDKVAPKRLQVADVPIQYQQGEKPLCFGKSMASVLFYIDLKEAAGNIN